MASTAADSRPTVRIPAAAAAYETCFPEDIDDQDGAAADAEASNKDPTVKAADGSWCCDHCGTNDAASGCQAWPHAARGQANYRRRRRACRAARRLEVPRRAGQEEGLGGGGGRGASSDEAAAAASVEAPFKSPPSPPTGWGRARATTPPTTATPRPSGATSWRWREAKIHPETTGEHVAPRAPGTFANTHQARPLLLGQRVVFGDLNTAALNGTRGTGTGASFGGEKEEWGEGGEGGEGGGGGPFPGEVQGGWGDCAREMRQEEEENRKGHGI